MLDFNRHGIRNIIIIMILVFSAITCRMITKYDIVTGFFNMFFSLVRSGIYIGMILAWGVSVKRRILHSTVRGYLLAITVLLLFWMSVRTCKYLLLTGLDAMECLCWYCFYIPMIFVPLMGLFAAECLGRTEDYILPKKLKLLYIPSLMLVICVLCNNWHQLVFSFPENLSPSSDVYHYGYMYIVVLLWILAESVAFFVVLVHKSHIQDKHRRIWVTLIPVVATVVYVILYIVKFPVLYIIAGDMTAFFSLMIMVTFELCIRTGLIPSNTHHEELFRNSMLGALITDNGYNVCYAAEKARIFDSSILRNAEKHPVDLGCDRLSGAPVRGGHIFWIDNVSEINRILRKLRETGSKLSENNDLLKAEVELREKKVRADEQMRLYDKIREKVEPQLIKLENMIASDDSEISAKEKLSQICVISAYIKRLGNLILLSEEFSFLPVRELEYCLRESVENLRLCSVACSLSCRCDGIITKEHAVSLYTAFEIVVEAALPTASALMVDLCMVNGIPELAVNISCDQDEIRRQKEALDKTGVNSDFVQQDSDSHIVMRFPERGGSVMTPFLSIPLPAKSLLMLMMLAAAVFSFFCFFIVADTNGRKSRKAALLMISAVSVILLTFIADAHNSYMSGDSLSDTDAVCMGIPAVCMAIYLLVISAYMAWVLYKESVICRNMITRSSIRESADMMPIGLCFARPGGHPYLVNRRMEELSHAVLGRSLQNEESFWSDVSAGGIEPDTRRITIDGISAIMLGDGSVWAFDRKIINVSGTDVVQLTASDMTELYQLAQRLREENHVLQKMNDRLRNYGETVEELTRTRERLAAKIRIHDSIGQNLMSTRYFLMKGADEDDAYDIFVKWKRIAALLRQEDSGEECTGVIKYLTNAAESAGVRIILEGEMPEKPETQELIVAAGAEALTNAVRHAGVRELRMIIKENSDSYLIDFLNDCGDAANSSPMTVSEGGGLSSLRYRVESAGGIMSVKRGDVFTLSIILPKERNGDQ